MSINDLRVERISLLPDRLDRLREEAAEEGSDIIEDLLSEWQDNTNRFTRPGEMLVAATVNDLPLNFHPVAIRASTISVTP